MTGMLDIAFAGRLASFDLDVAFQAPARGVTGLFGPSGCGKTTILRCVAGLQRFPNGRCVVNGDTWQDDKTFLPTHRRPIGYVFQEASLFPHLSVDGNLLFATRGRKPAAADGVSYDEAVDLLGLKPLLGRAPHNLSGGERQRVALGRALLSQPKLLLMDEPLSALDRDTKDEILPFLERLHGALSIPVLYVTHDIAEIERLADHLVLLERGRIRAHGPLSELQSDPDLPLSHAASAAVSLDATVEAYDAQYGLATLRVAGGSLIAPGAPATIGARLRVRIGAGDVSLARGAAHESTILNHLPARILHARRGATTFEMDVVLALGADGAGARVLSRVTLRSWESMGLRQGDIVTAQVKGVAIQRAQA